MVEHIAFTVFDRMIEIDQQVVANESTSLAGKWTVFNGNYFPSVFGKIEQGLHFCLFFRHGVNETMGKGATHLAENFVFCRWYNFVTNIDGSCSGRIPN